ncbi:arylsulfatase [Pseudonocardia sichuanensis]
MSAARRPDVVVILADDMGFSDLGCYGGEIRTPHTDRLGRDGVRLSAFYNTARCSPSRASLLTGLHPHQTGIGILTNDDAPRGYRGTLNDRCVTAAEVLRASGYATCLAGKWHLASQMRVPNDAWPTRRGFDRFFGTLTGCGSYYDPGTLTRGESDASAEAREPGFLYTDAIADEAVAFVEERSANAPEQPLFLYTAFTAPHWPLHAPEPDVTALDGVFDEGWDVLRERRMKRLVDEGVLPAGTALSDRDPTQPAWADAERADWQVRRMQVYAAQIERMDAGIGRIVDALERTGRLDDAVVVVLSDNGASPEDLPKGEVESFRLRTDIVPTRTRDGRELRVGNDPGTVPGPEDTYSSYGRAWANLSNTPFRFYKRWVHEGGIAAPFLVHWPAGGLAAGSVVDLPVQLVDVLPTLLECTGADYPGGDRSVLPLEGRSVLPALRGEPQDPVPLYWEHTGNAAIRVGRWKLVREHPGPWELYDLDLDRTELQDLAGEHPDLVAELSGRWQRWADRVGVIPWDTTLAIYAERGLGDEEAAG